MSPERVVAHGYKGIGSTLAPRPGIRYPEYMHDVEISSLGVSARGDVGVYGERAGQLALG